MPCISLSYGYIKLRLDVVSGDSSGPLPMFANMLILKSLTISSTYLARSQLIDLKYHPNGFLSFNLKKFSV